MVKPLIAILAVLLTSTACSRQKTVDREKLRSELLSSISFASETELFFERVMQGRITARFAEAHAEYLADEIEREANELREAVPTRDIDPQFKECKRQTELLAHEVTASKTLVMDKPALAEVIQRIANIRQILQSTKSSL